MDIAREIRRLHDETKERYRALGIIDGLIIAEKLAHQRGQCELAAELAMRAHELLHQLDAELETSNLIERAQKRN